MTYLVIHKQPGHETIVNYRIIIVMLEGFLRNHVIQCYDLCCDYRICDTFLSHPKSRVQLQSSTVQL